MTTPQRQQTACRQRGAALLLVMIAVGITTILALSFLASQRPTAVVASNIDRKVKARAIAESVLRMAIDYVSQDATWRTDKTSGQWMAGAALDGGTFDLFGVDEIDNDLANDASEAVVLTAIATYDGVTHRVSARVTPTSTTPGNRLLLVVGNSAVPSAQDQAKAALFASWGYEVTLIDDGASQSDYDDAALLNDVAYITIDVSPASVGSMLRDAAIGVVCEETYLQDDLGFTSASTTSDMPATGFDITDNSHMITAGFPLGALAFTQSAAEVRYVTSSLASGVTALADRLGTGTDATLIVADQGEQLHHGGAAGRRVMLPTGEDFDITALTADGTTIVQRSLQWASGYDVAADVPTVLAKYTFQEQSVPDPVLVGHWKLDETVGGGSIYLSNNFTIENGSYIDAYSSSNGAYGGANQHLDVLMNINATGAGDVVIDDAMVYGDVRVGSGADPASVVQLIGSGTVTGSTSAQASSIVIPTYDAPAGFGTHDGNQTYSGGAYTWSTDLHYNKVTIKNGATVTIDGNIEVRLSNMLEMNDGHIVLNPGASLTLWMGHNMDIHSGSTINTDTSRPGDVQIIQYGNNRTTVIDDAQIVGTLHGARDITLRGGAEVYGNVVIEEDLIIEDGAIHTDYATRLIGVAPASFADATDNANDGTVVSAASEAPGRIGYAFSFDGSDDYLTIPHHDEYLLNQGSVGLFFNADSLSGEQGLFSKDSAGFDNGGHLHLYTDGDRLAAQIQTTADDPFRTGSTVTLRSASGALSTGNWHHALVTFGDGQFRLYLDGVLADAADHLGSLGTSSGGSGNDEPIVLGASATNSSNQSATPVRDHFAGRLDDVRLYDQPLDATQAARLAIAADPGARVAPGYVIPDVSGYGSALDLVIHDTTAIAYPPTGGLIFTGDTIATSTRTTTKLHDAIETNGEFSLEVLLTRALPATTDSPSRIVSDSSGPSTHNFMLGQDYSYYEARARDSATGINGTLSPEFISTTGLSALADTHLVLSYKDGEVSVYVDGVLDESRSTGGTLDNWASDLFLAVGGAYDNTNHWHGTLKRVVVYDRGFNSRQAENVYNGEAPGPGGSASGAGNVVWDEVD